MERHTENVLKISIDFDSVVDEVVTMIATIEVRGDEVLKAKFTGSDTSSLKTSEDEVSVFKLLDLCKRYVTEYRGTYYGGRLFKKSSQSDIPNKPIINTNSTYRL